MQSSTVEINSALQLLESCTKYLTEYQSSEGFERAVVDARELVKALDVEPDLLRRGFGAKSVCSTTRATTMLSSIPNNVSGLMCSKKFWITLYHLSNHVLNRRKNFDNTGVFLFKKISESNKLFKIRKDLDIILTDGDDSDISGTELCDEIQSIETLLSDVVNYPLKMLQCLKTNELQNTLPNLWIASRIL
jgi:hypothetical protein